MVTALCCDVVGSTSIADLVNMIYGFPTFHGAVGEALGAYERGIVRVLDPPTSPMFEDPPDSWHSHDEAVSG